MKTHTVTTYSAKELKDQFPDGFARALAHWQNHQDEIFWQDEIIDSLKSLLKHAGITLRDYCLGAYNRGNMISVAFNPDEAGELTGKRAMAWLENNLYGPLRISFTTRNRWELAKYNGGYRSCHPANSPLLQSYSAGRVKPCPFTGYCADEDYMDALNKAVRDGSTLKEAFEELADTCQSLLESEAEDQASEEYFLNHAEANEFQFTENGEQF